MVCPGTLFIGDDGALRCIPMKIGVKSEHWQGGPLAHPPAAGLVRVEREWRGALLRAWPRRAESNLLYVLSPTTPHTNIHINKSTEA
jgi:hypothetical protein